MSNAASAASTDIKTSLVTSTKEHAKSLEVNSEVSMSGWGAEVSASFADKSSETYKDSSV